MKTEEIAERINEKLASFRRLRNQAWPCRIARETVLRYIQDLRALEQELAETKRIELKN